jgi:nucleoside-diphosphate-sugar epimerase
MGTVASATVSHGSTAQGVIAVIGGTGFVGRYLVESWPDDHRAALRMLVHRSCPDWLGSYGLDTRLVDLSDLNSLVASLSGARVVINLLRPVGDGKIERTMSSLVSSFAGTSVDRYIHCSSIDVYGRTRESVVNEETIPMPHTPYEREHLVAEQAALKASCDVCILRLGAVFGPGGRNLVSMANEMRYGPMFKLVLRRALYSERRMHLVGVRTVVEALRFLVYRQEQIGRVCLLLTEDEVEDNKFSFVQDTFASAFGRRPLAWVPPLPIGCLRLALALRGAGNTDPIRRFSGKRIATLGFSPRTNFQDSLTTYIDDLRARHHEAAP